MNISNFENAAEFSRIIDISLSGNGCMEIDSNTLFVKYIMVKKFNISIFFLLSSISKSCCYTSRGIPEERSDEQCRLAIAR